MKNSVCVLLIAILGSAHAIAKPAPDFEGRWMTVPTDPHTTSEKKGNTTVTITTNPSSKFAIQICPNAKRDGWELAVVPPTGEPRGGTPVKVNSDGSIEAVQQADGSQTLKYVLRTNQQQLTGTVQPSASQSLPTIFQVPISFVRTGKC